MPPTISGAWKPQSRDGVDARSGTLYVPVPPKTPSTKNSRDLVRYQSDIKHYKNRTKHTDHPNLNKTGRERLFMCHVTTGKGKEAAAAAAELETVAPQEPVIVPSETIFMQIVDFLLDTKATPVNYLLDLNCAY